MSHYFEFWIHVLYEFAFIHPVLALVYFSCIVCLMTRVITSLSPSSRPQHVEAHPDRPLKIPVLPYWIPWLGHTLNVASGLQSYLSQLARRTNLGVFGLWMGGKQHNIIKSPSLMKALLNDHNLPIDRETILFQHMNNVWDDRHSLRDMNHSVLFGPISATLANLMREDYLTTAIGVAKSNLERRVWNLVSGSKSIVDQNGWERAGKVEIVDPDEALNGKDFVAEAELQPLLRNFMGEIATTAIMGRDFVENNPNLLSDLWVMDTRFMAFTFGVPKWFPGMTAAGNARERIINAVQEHHEALEKFIDGKDPGSQWNDMSDVSGVMVERVKAWRAANAPRRAYGSGDGVVMWALNNNSNLVLFWLIWYIISDRSLLKELRTEIAPFVRKRPEENDEASRLPIKEAPTIQIDLQGLRTKCPLLNGAFMETMRLEVPVLTYRFITKDFVLTESKDDAHHFGKKEPDTYLFSKGDLICLPQGVHNADPSYWPSPEKFDPRRFWTRMATNQEKTTGEEDIKLDYKTMKVWSGGKSMCKGKNFAESEIVMFAAAIIMCWDMEPVGNKRKWVHPGRTPGPAVNVPRKSIRVRMWRREDW